MKRFYLLITLIITGLMGVKAAVPTTLPTPTQNPNAVLSFWGYYKNTYGLNSGATPIAWSGSGFNVVNGTVNKPSGQNGVIDLSADTDFTGMTHLHIDLWAETANQDLKIDIRNWQGGGKQTDTYTKTNFNGTTTNAWISIDIALTDISGIANLANIVNVLFFGDDGAYYIGNVYMYNNNFATGPTTPAPTPPSRPTQSYLSLYSDTYGDITGNIWTNYPGTGVVESSNYIVTPSDKSRKIFFNGVAGEKHAIYEWSTATDISVLYTYLYFDIWVGDALDGDWLYACLYNSDPSTVGYNFLKSPVQAITAGETGKWVSCKIPISSFTYSWEAGLNPNTILQDLRSIRFYTDKAATNKAIYIDNVYFYSSTEPDKAPENTNFSSNIVVPVYGQYAGTPTYTWTNQSPFVDTTDANESANIELSNNAGSVSTLTPNPILSLVTPSAETANMLHLNVWVSQPATEFKLKLNGTSTTYTIPAGALRVGRWNTLNFPLKRFGASFSQISSIEFSGSGVIYVDNLFFYYTEINPDPVAELIIDNVSQGTFYTIGEAVTSVPTTEMQGKKVEIAIFENSNEPSTVVIPSGDWTSFTIYPRGSGSDTITVTHTGTSGYSLFEFYPDAENVTISGKLNNQESGASRRLVLQGQYLPPNQTDGKYNTIIYLNQNSEVEISDCLFRGLATDNRPEAILRGSGTDITIVNNFFENCLYLGDITQASSSFGVLSIGGGNHISTPGWEISGNHFYETQPVDFTAAGFRVFINFITADNSNISGYTTPVKILNNKIGGSGRDASGNITGTMQLGSESAGATSSIVWGIYLSSTWPTGNNYSLIQGNEIASIELVNPTSGIYQYDGSQMLFTDDLLAEFVGINNIDGLTVISENKIHDIKNTVKAKSGGGQQQRYLLLGIRSEIYGGNAKYIIENNEIQNIYGDLLTDEPGQSTMIYGIFARMENSSDYAATNTKGFICGNKIIMGHTGTKLMNTYSNIGAIGVRMHNLKSSPYANSGQFDIFNNICVFNEFKYTAGNLNSAEMIAIMNDTESSNGVINCYNNIAYLQPKAANSFSNIQTRIGGITLVDINKSLSGTTNIFHNTVLLKDLADESVKATAAYIFEYRENKGIMNAWNNNFVNLNSNGHVLYSDGNAPNSNYSDYNNYYVPATGAFAVHSYTDTIATFDRWKFSNTLSYLDRTTGHDSHSRFLNPDFVSTADVPLTMAGIENLYSNLKPKRFLGGKKTDVSKLTNLITLVNGSEVTVIDNLPMTDNDNLDSNLSKRRPYLPTMGAVNTSFSNYWRGVTNSWTDTNNWGDGKVPGTAADAIDVVFAENAASNLALDSERTIHDIYNDTQRHLDLNSNSLIVTGYIGQERPDNQPDYAKIIASNFSTLTYNGLGNGTTSGTPFVGAAAQHIFMNAFVNNTVNNLYLDNKSDYFVLLHGEKITGSTEPTGATLSIQNDFWVKNPNITEINYPDKDKYPNDITDKHIGALNASWYKTNLQFSGYAETGNSPLLTGTSTPYSDGRIEAGQRIPRHGIFNDQLYNLISDSKKVITYHDNLYVNNQLIINSGKNLEVAADKFMQVKGLTQNNGGNAGLLIRSRILDEPGVSTSGNYTADYITAFNKVFLKDTQTFVPARPNATFIYSNGKNGVANTSVPATVEMYSPAAVDNDASGDYTQRWQYFTPALASTARTNFVGVTDIAKWNPQGDIYDANIGSPYWRWVDNGNLNAMDGYTLTQASPVVYSMTGNLTNSDISNPMTFYVYPEEYVNTEASKLGYQWHDQLPNDGKYVFGNPYTAAIDIRELIFGSELDATVYIFNTGHNDDWKEKEGSNENYLSDKPGENIVVPQFRAGTTYDFGGTIGEITFPAFIPSMQGFTICFDKDQSPVDKTTTSSFTLNYDITAGNETVGKNDIQQRSVVSESEMAEPETHNMLIELKRGDISDRILLTTHPDTKKGFDNGWDGRKDVSESEKIQLFTIEEEDQKPIGDSYYQVSTMDDINKTWLGIVADKAKTEYQLVFHYIGMDMLYSKIQLEDTMADKVIDITANGSSYSFVSDRAGIISKRFRIITEDKSGSGIDEEPEKGTLKVYGSAEAIFVENEGEAGTISLYDITGKYLLTNTFDANSKTRIDTNLRPGVYVVKLMAGDRRINQTILLN